MVDFEALARPGICSLRAYDPGHDLVALRRRFAEAQLVELGSNENPYGASPKARQAIVDALAGIHVYPDPLGGELKHALAARHRVDPASLLLGNGSHELLMQFAQVFAGPEDEVVASKFGFAVYALAAQAAGAALRPAPALPRDHAMPRGHDLAALHAAVGPRTRLVYLANPNNPTGTWYGAREFEAFMAGLPAQVLVVVDEAYAEFVDAPDWASALPLVARHPNLVVTRTFSKAYALAGLAGRLRGGASATDRGDGAGARELQRQRTRACRRAGRAGRCRTPRRLGGRQQRAACAIGRGADCARAEGLALADQFPAGRVRRRCGAGRGTAGRAGRGAAADGRLRAG